MEWNLLVRTNDLNVARNDLAGCGTTAAALAMGGTPPAAGATEEWNSPFTGTREFTLS